MNNREKISNRLKELRAKNNFSQAYVAEKLFVSQAAYSLMEGYQNAVTAGHILQLSKLYDITTEYLLTGNKKLIEMTPENRFLPFIDAKAHAGFIENAHRESVFDTYEYYRIPDFKTTEETILFEIEGKSMLRTILSGDILVCQNQKTEYVVDGSISVVVTEKELFTTRVFKDQDNNYFRMKSDNPNDESKKEIKKSISSNYTS